MLCDDVGSWTVGLEDSRPAVLVLADLMMVGSQPCFKEQASTPWNHLSSGLGFI